MLQFRDQARRFQGHSRQRKVISISLLSSFVILVLLVLATLVTPMLAVEKIKITGLSKVPQKSVMAAVKTNLGKPLALVNQQEIADQLSKFKLIESISIISELPHTLHIAVAERQPIAIVDVNGASVLYDAAAVNLGAATYNDKYPRVLISDDPRNSKAFGLAIDVLLALPVDLLDRVAVIDAKTKDDVRLQLRGYSAQMIIWGDSSQSTLKSKVLAALIANQKQTDRVTYDVSSPSAPVVRYR
jgi:cell division protein FtsQ